MTGALEVGLLGPVVVDRDGTPVPLGAAKLRVILALLALRNGEVVSLDALIEGLWPGSHPATASKTLQGYVSELRHELEPGETPDRSVIATRTPGYVLELPPESIDLMRFERLWRAGREALREGDSERASRLLDSALALWRGDPLMDIAGEGEISLELGRLEEMRLLCTEDRFDVDLAQGGPVLPCAELERLVAEHPFRERLSGQLMLALYRSGRQAEALDVYRSLYNRLSEQLGVSPTPAMASLEHAILNQDPALLSDQGVPAVERRSLLVAGQTSSDLEPLTWLATQITGAEPERDLMIVRVVSGHNGADRSQLLQAATRRLSEHRDRLVERGSGRARIAAFASSDVGADLIRLAEHQEADLILIEGSSDLLGGHFGAADHLLSHAPCDVAVHLHRGGEPTGEAIVVPFGGNEHDWAALEIGVLVARQSGLPLLVAGAARDEEGADSSRLLADASLIVQRSYGVLVEPAIVAPGPAGMLELAAGALLVLAGLSARFRTRGLGETRYRIAVEAPCDVVFVRRGARPGVLAPSWTSTSFGWSLPAASEAS